MLLEMCDDGGLLPGAYLHLINKNEHSSVGV